MDKENTKIPSKYSVGLAKLVLENNYFEFNERICRQKLGTAIGTKFVQAFVNLFIANWEECFVETCVLRP